MGRTDRRCDAQEIHPDQAGEPEQNHRDERHMVSLRCDAVPWGKVLEALPDGLSREAVLFFDAVDLLIPACQLQYARITEIAAAYTVAQDLIAASDDEVEAARLRDQTADMQAMVMTDAGSFVSSIQRLRRVVKRLRGDDALRIAKKAFEAAVSSYEPARHHLEHLDTAIPAIVPTGHGALGAMSWFFVSQDDSLRSIFIIPGHLGEGANATIRMESSFRRPVDHVWITIAGADYYLTGAADAVDRLRERLAAWSMAFVG